MAYRLPGVKVTQIFLNAQPALAAQALPNLTVGPAYQLVNDDLLGTYSGNLQVYPYASLAAGAQVDLEKEDANEQFSVTKKPIKVLIENAIVQILAQVGTGAVNAGNLQAFLDATADQFQNVQAGDLITIVESTGLTIVGATTDGATTPANPDRLTGATGTFANVKTGDVVAVTGGGNTNTGNFNVLAKLSDELLLLDGNVNDGVGASSDVAFSITGNRGTANAGDYRVRTVTSNNELELESPLVEAEAPITYSIKREVSSIEIPRVDSLPGAGFLAEDTGITLPAALQFVVDGNSFDIIAGEVKSEYRGLRNDLASQIREFSEVSEVFALFGGVDQVTPQNPMGFAITVALQNAVTATRALGLDGQAVSNEPLSYLNAYDVIQSEDEASPNPNYAITPLTQNPAIHQSLKAHVEGLSQPDNKLERVGLINRSLISEEELQEKSTTNESVTGARIIVNTQVDGECDAGVDDTVLTDNTVDAFLNVQPGDTVTIVGGTNANTGELDVVSKTDNNNLVLSGAIVSSGASADLTYFINRKDGLGADGITFYDRESSFFGDNIAPGDIIRVTAASNPLFIGDHVISNVISDKQCEIAQVPGITSLVTGVEYEVVRELTRANQAAAIAGYSSSIGSRRMVHVWPDVLEAQTGNSVEKVPGFYACVAVGALITGLPSQQGFTNLTLSGFLGFEHSSRYFKESDLNTIAGGGTFILAQEGEGQALFIRHQLTTDTSTIQFQELSITKNVDFAAKFIRNNYKSFIGVYNVTDATLDEIKSRAKALITFLQETTRQPRIGGVIRSGTLTRASESETQPDTVLLTFRCNFPVPLNNIDIDLEVE